MRVPTLILAIELHSKKPNGAADKDPLQLHAVCAHRSQAAHCSAIVAEAQIGRYCSCGIGHELVGRVKRAKEI